MYTCSRATYDAIETKDAYGYYWIKDTKEVYLGSNAYAKAVNYVTALPTSSISQGTLYYNTTDGSCSTYNGTAWVTIIPTILTTIADTDNNSTSLVTAGAVVNYLSSIIASGISGVSSVVWDTDDSVLKVTTNNTTSDVAFTNMIEDVVYSSQAITVSYVGDKADTVYNLPQDVFLSAASYDADSTTLTLTLNDSETVEVNLGDLVSTLTMEAGSGISIVTGTDAAYSISVKVSTNTGNQLSVLSDGSLYVAEYDDSAITTALASKVDVVAGSSLITVAELAQISTNASDIEDLESSLEWQSIS